MKVPFRSILFALVVSAAACGGGRETPTSSETPLMPHLPTATSDASVQAQTPAPVAVEIAVPTKYEDALALGRELIGKGELKTAKQMLEAAIKLDKKKAEPHIEMARLYIATNEKGLAIASAKKAIKLAPLSSQAWNTKGRAELNAHNYDNAIEAFSKAVEINADNTYAWNNLGYTELLLKKYEDAAEHLLEATSKKDAAGFMFNNLGTALEHLDRLDEARTAYESGGKRGSKEAVASRKRLEGVTSVAIVEKQDAGSGSKVKEYELTDEGSSEPSDDVKPDATTDTKLDEATTDAKPDEATTDAKRDTATTDIDDSTEMPDD